MGFMGNRFGHGKAENCVQISHFKIEIQLAKRLSRVQKLNKIHWT